ncbi:MULTISPECIES: c-type cytochrome [unclassified Acidiphilium]|jgi:cytochrome c|uniref:c-type cytochrome n=1 Tax=unclassified Acidiphilium TaxID=2617493 RepID=UPI000BD74C64|nr:MULTISPECIES: c-type cytochrome [unclassified Acidiphilium]OYV56615.1 MAG: cytochrome C [Acidiphilium sp. 20-67-58]HQT62258.1 c-type cytochrome [Acidiphilium sp.]
MTKSSISSFIGASVIGAAAAGLLSAAAFAAGGAGAMPKGEQLAKGSDCFSCHAINQKVVGPAFDAVAQKFAGQSGAEDTLVNAIRKGHVGTWGKIPMPAHPQLSEADTKEIVSWILSLKGAQAAGAPAAASGKTYSYKVNGKTVKVDFPIFQPGTEKVTKDVFRGYELFNSYCFRCHGEDAVGGSYAPNLRASLNNGMTEAGFTNVAMTGVKAKGMPSWAGFFTPHQIHVIYQYVKARAVGAVGTGAPKE